MDVQICAYSLTTRTVFSARGTVKYDSIHDVIYPYRNLSDSEISFKNQVDNTKVALCRGRKMLHMAENYFLPQDNVRLIDVTDLFPGLKMDIHADLAVRTQQYGQRLTDHSLFFKPTVFLRILNAGNGKLLLWVCINIECQVYK